MANKCESCQEMIASRDGCDKDLCCYCDGTIYVLSSYVNSEYGYDFSKEEFVHSIPIVNDKQGRDVINFCEFYKFLQSKNTEKYILNKAHVEYKARNITAYLKNKYHNTVTKINIFKPSSYKFNNKLLRSYRKFEYENIRFSRIEKEYDDTNDNIIIEYAYSMESDESVKARLEENYNRYCTISEKLKHIAKCIFNIIEKDLDTLEKISAIMDINIDFLKKNDMYEKLNVLSGNFKGILKKSIKNDDIISVFQYLAKHSEHIYNILDNPNILDLTTENEIKKSGIIDNIYISIKRHIFYLASFEERELFANIIET